MQHYYKSDVRRRAVPGFNMHCLWQYWYSGFW